MNHSKYNAPERVRNLDLMLSRFSSRACCFLFLPQDYGASEDTYAAIATMSSWLKSMTTVFIGSVLAPDLALV
jgi:hypothetical protein